MLHTPQSKQFGDCQGFLVVTVNEDCYEVRIGTGGGEEGAETPGGEGMRGGGELLKVLYTRSGGLICKLFDHVNCTALFKKLWYFTPQCTQNTL